MPTLPFFSIVNGQYFFTGPLNLFVREDLSRIIKQFLLANLSRIGNIEFIGIPCISAWRKRPGEALSIHEL